MEAETWIKIGKGLVPIIIAGAVSFWNEGAQATDLRVSESRAIAAAEDVRHGRTLDNWREDIEMRMVQDGKCDTALEGFARHRDDERDWRHVLEACHSEGEIDAGP